MNVTELGSAAIDASHKNVTPRGLAVDVRSHVTSRRASVPGWSQLVLSLFPGVDLLGRGFESQGYTVVRGPDLIFGGDIRRFTAPAGRFDGIIAGSPCPDFSRARRAPATGYGVEMLGEFRRVVSGAHPVWWLLENVPACPDVRLPGYSHQRIDIDARDLGVSQRRLRHFQFGHHAGLLLSLCRPSVIRNRGGEPTALASRGGRDWSRFCSSQGLPDDFDLPSFTIGAKYRAVGNGVHVAVARFLALAILNPVDADTKLCNCGCARPVEGRATMAGAACRKRMQRRRDSAGAIHPRMVTRSA